MIKYRRIYPFLVFILLFAGKGHSQETLGIVNSNYNGVLTGIINPANLSNSELKLNFNLLAGDVFVSSNYIYIHKKDYSFLKPLKVNLLDDQYLYVYNYSESNYYDSVYYYDFFKNTKPRNFYFNNRIVGPSVMYHKGIHAFSLITGLRTNLSVVHLSSDLANFIYRGMQFRPQQSTTYTSKSVIRMAMLSWAEIGLGYSVTLQKNFDYQLDAGLTAKLLLGLGGAYATISNLTYMIPNADSIYVDKMDGTIGFSLPFNTANNTAAVNPLIKGKGFSLDAGVVYMKFNQRTDRNGKVPEYLAGTTKDYLYKAGLSLLDFGWIKFNNLAQVHDYNNVENALWSGLKSFNPTNFDQVLRSASYNLLGDSSASLTDATAISVWLPTALSAQFDYNFGNNVFVNATCVQGFRLGSAGISRPSVISLTPRYETRYFEVNLPFSFYDFRDPQMGLAIRIFNLVIGTEKLGTFVNLTDVNGMDVYFSLGFNLDMKSKSKSQGCDTYENYNRYRVK
jgi:hypothetical protein